MKKNQPSDTTLMFIKISRIVSYIVYAYALVASSFLALAFVLLLFGANQSTPFVHFVYKTATEFGQPFRGIFPTHPVGETGYFSSSALFAILMYMFLAMGMHALIVYITSKMVIHQKELEEAIDETN